ncbi:DUF6597 domain-containing transcriptional factor [Nonomuraea maritima]|uniref:DUF6597 domain-containing transcriptional factor n=1 Tax=Nonomuraea maritima TaxID=683260 RepID=UPI00370FECA4
MYVERPATPDLTRRVACEWVRTSSAAATALVVPDGCVDLIWGPEGLFVAGPDTGPMPASVGAGDALAGIRFRPGAAGGFFGVPLHELRDQRVALADLPGILDPGVLDLDLGTGADRDDVHGDVRGGDCGEVHGDVQARLAAMRAAVRRRLVAGADALDPAAPAVAAGLRAGRSIAQVASNLGFSERHLHRRCVAAFGYAPKTLQRVLRFQHALRLARAGVPLAEVAVTAGYADQAHLAHDVRRLSGGPIRRLLSPARAA